MSQNIDQIFISNPASSMISSDLLYLGRSPYGSADDFAITFANFVASIGTATPTASTISRWDVNKNFSANSLIPAFATTPTAAATTTLLVGSAYVQEFTGSTTQIVVLPVTATLVAGQAFYIINDSSGAVTVNSSGGNPVQVMAASTALLVTCINTSLTTAAAWQSSYISDAGGSVTSGLINQLAWYAATGDVVSGLATAANGVLITSNSSVPSLLANGTAGYVLTANSGAPPSWQTVSASGAVTSLAGDAGSATPSSGVITVSGGSTGLTTSGSGSTLSLLGTLAVGYGGTGKTSVTVAPAATSWAGWDANSNLSANNFLVNYATTATAASSTALTIASAYYQYWTGTTTQTVTLPHLTTPLGASFYFVNNSTGNVTVEVSGGQTVQVMAGGSSCLFTCIAANGTTAASWNAQYFIDSDVSGAVLLAPSGTQTITTYGLVLPSVSFSSTSGIIGTTTNDNAAAGSVGEVISSTVLFGAAVSCSSGATATVTTISLTAGDWDVWGTVWSAPASGTITTNFAAAINTTNSAPGTPNVGTAYSTLNFISAASQDNQLPTGACRISLSTTTTVYLLTNIVFSVSTMGAYGQLTARRRR